MKPKTLGIYSGISLAMLFWSLSFVFYKIAYRNLEPIALIFFRLIVASLFLLTVTVLTGSFEKIRRADFGRFLLLSLFEPLLYFLGESYGMNLVSSTVGAVIVSTIPLLTPVAAFLFFRERITWLRIAGITLSFTGVLLVLTGRGFVLVAPPLGIALMFLAVFSAVSYTSLIVNLTRKYRSMTIILIQSIIGIFLFLPIFLLTDLKETRAITWSWPVLYPVLFLGIFPSSISFILYTSTIRKIGITRTNLFTNFIPVFTALFSALILNEVLTKGKIAGMALVILGLMLAQTGLRKIEFVKALFKRMFR